MSTATIVQRMLDGTEQPVTRLNMHGVNYPEMASTPGSEFLYPLEVPFDGSWASSRKLTFRLKIAKPFHSVRDVKFTIDQFVPPDGWDLRIGVSGSPSPSTVGGGLSIIYFMVGHGDGVNKPNLMPGFSTAYSPNETWDSTPIMTDFSSQYVHVWARANSVAFPGPVLGAQPIVFRFYWLED